MNRKHPSAYSKAVLQQASPIIHEEAARLGRPIEVLDPMAGIGKCFSLESPKVRFEAIDLDPDWEDQDRRVQQGNALDLSFPDGRFDGIFVSPVYGNRMGDHHDAKDSCSQCAGMGFIPLDEPFDPPCSKCKGSGLSPRNTYFHRLGREVSEGSSCYMQWDTPKGIIEYQRFHARAWIEATRVVARPSHHEPFFLLNISNHLRRGEEMPVAEWHRGCLQRLGWKLQKEVEVNTPRNHFGANGGKRVAHEYLFLFRR